MKILSLHRAGSYLTSMAEFAALKSYFSIFDFRPPATFTTGHVVIVYHQSVPSFDLSFRLESPRVRLGSHSSQEGRHRVHAFRGQGLSSPPPVMSGLLPASRGPWHPPIPSLAALPVDRTKTEPTPAYYKLQFGDDVTGFSYYVRTLAVIIGRNCVSETTPKV